MGKSVIIVLFYIGFGLWDLCSGLPIDFTAVGTGKLNAIWLTSSFLLAVGFLIGIVSLIIGCICCRNGRGFQQNEAKPAEEFSNSHGCLATPAVDGFVNPTAASEITIFPPLGINSDVSSRSSIVHFEPLPNLKPQAPNLRPAAFSYSEQEISSQDWFYNPYNNFPRNQLKYLQEYGKGWFGRVVEGEAQNIVPNEKVSKVIVKILHEDATPTDQMYFLHEVKFYRDLKHPNILGLLGRCLETEPFLILLESCPNGDLKSFLTQNMASAQALVEQGVTLRMCNNITSGLQYMHDNKFIHTDLAARNCLVTPDLTVKIGDYGNSIEVFKSDYYCAGSVALPVRWCAPETLKCTDVTIETREVTPLANIWTLAIVFWEICEFCKLPYEELNDDQVIVRVLGEKNYFLQMPKMSCLYKDELYHLMKLCWNPPLQRPTASQIGVILSNLISSMGGDVRDSIDPKRLSQDFEARWEKSKPNCIPKTDNVTEGNDFVTSTVANTNKFKGAKVADSSYMESPLGMFMSSKTKGQDSPRFRLKSDNMHKEEQQSRVVGDEKTPDSDGAEGKSKYEAEPYFGGMKKSDSVKNLTGSIERLNTVAQELQEKEFKADFDLNSEIKPPQFFNADNNKGANPEIDSWLKGVEVNNEEDETFVRKISEAIRDLDAALAMEKTSSSEENSGKSSHQSSPGKETKENEDPVVVDFKLGGDTTTSLINFIPKSFELSSLQNSEEPQSINFTSSMPNEKGNDFPNTGSFDSYESNSMMNPRNSFKFKNTLFDESLRGNDSILNNPSRNSSDTEDEIWRRRIERGEFSEKVKEKSKSIANLMVLTHIDASDESDVDLDKSLLDRSLTRNSYSRRHHSNAKTSLSSNNFGSENDVTNAVLEDNFKESLKKLSNDHKEYGHFDSLGMILPTTANRHNVWGCILRKSSSEENLVSAACMLPVESNVIETAKLDKLGTDPSEMLKKNESVDSDKRNNFLGNMASKNLGNDVDGGVNSQNSASLNNFNKIDSVESNVDSVYPASVECIQKVDDVPNCDIPENPSECANTRLNGSSQINDSCGSERLDDDKPAGISENVSNDDDKDDDNKACCSIKHSPEDESPLVKDSSEGKDKTHLKNEDAIIETVVNSRESSLPEIVPTFFGAGNSTNSLPNPISGEDETKFCANEQETVPRMHTETKGLEPVSVTIEKEEGTPANSKPNVIPEIKITEEKHLDVAEEETENVEMGVKNIRPFKFVLKDDKSAEPSEIPVSNDTVSTENNLEATEQKTELDDKKNSSVYEAKFEKCELEKFLESERSVSHPVVPVLPAILPPAKIAEKENEEELGVIIGACEDYTLDYFKGLKTTFGSPDDCTPNPKDEQYLNAPEVTINKDLNLDVWDKHLEKSITQMIDNTNFDDINFFASSLESSGKDGSSDAHIDNSISTSPNTSLSNADDVSVKDKKGDDPLHSSSFTNLNGNMSEEEYENSKLRTPDDERSSDSGFRDKGSLSESVEDACEGKYNLEDIEAELEEAYVKGAFNNCEIEKDKDSLTSPNQNSGFEYEETKFYEDGNKNEDDFSDIDGEIEFWQNQENVDYYSEISEFNPVSSQGWYLHPPDDENFYVSNENVDDEFMNALREALKQNLPVQSRSFHRYDGDCDESSGDDKITEEEQKYMTKVSAPLSPILEERDHGDEIQVVYHPQESAAQKSRKSIVNLVESGRWVDTNAFMQYLDHMVETEGKDKDSVFSQIIDRERKTVGSRDGKSGKECKGRNLELDDGTRDANSGDILVVNMETSEVRLINGTESPRKTTKRMNGELERDDILDADEDSPDEDGLIFTPGSVTPERDRSLSDPSRSSNGSRVDVSSDVTISSPDNLSECFLTPTSEKSPADTPERSRCESKLDGVQQDEVSCEDKSSHTEKYVSAESSVSQRIADVSSNAKLSGMHSEDDNDDDDDDLYVSRPEGAYEMSTSFMGELSSDEEDGDAAEESCNVNTKNEVDDTREGQCGDNAGNDWESMSSGGEEELSSSSGEFIWKDGDKESRVKVMNVFDNSGNEALFQEMAEATKAPESHQPRGDKSPTSTEPAKRDDDGDDAKENREESNDEEDNDDGEYTDSEDDPDCSSTGSSASITDFVPSAWNSKATPSRPALRSPDKKSESQKRNVWFKKQKYHCIYEYPREPSDPESANNSPQKHFTCGIDPPDVPNRYFAYGLNSKLNLTNKYFPYGLPDIIDYSNYVDWETMEENDGSNVITDDKTVVTSNSSDDPNFYNINSFDYDFDGSGLSNDEFFVSSSARPFQGSSSQFFPSGKRFPIFGESGGEVTSSDFVTPDSGLEESSIDSPPARRADDGSDAVSVESDVPNVLDDLMFTFMGKSSEGKPVSDAFGENDSSSSNDLSTPSCSSPQPPAPVALGELRHARDKLKLDLPTNHNIDLDMTMGKSTSKIEELAQN